MFPPPPPWKARCPVEPDREYVAFTSRFFLDSVRVVPGFVAHSLRITRQAKAAPGVVGWALAADLAKLEFHTLSAWESEEDLRSFVAAGDHVEAMRRFAGRQRRPTLIQYFTVQGRDLPLTWKDAVARQESSH